MMQRKGEQQSMRRNLICLSELDFKPQNHKECRGMTSLPNSCHPVSMLAGLSVTAAHALSTFILCIVGAESFRTAPSLCHYLFVRHAPVSGAKDLDMNHRHSVLGVHGIA